MAATDGEKPVPTYGKGEVRLRVTRFAPDGVWNFNNTDDTCTICQEPLQGPALSMKDSTRKKRVDDRVSRGKCGCTFHYACIQGMLKKGQGNSCPNCNVVWAFMTDNHVGAGGIASFLKKFKGTDKPKAASAT